MAEITRRALIKRKPGLTVEQVERYLPTNYKVVDQTAGPITIGGDDFAGWTLDGYVIPRLLTGLISVKEIQWGPGDQTVEDAKHQGEQWPPGNGESRGGLFKDSDGNFYTPEAEQVYRVLHHYGRPCPHSDAAGNPISCTEAEGNGDG